MGAYAWVICGGGSFYFYFYIAEGHVTQGFNPFLKQTSWQMYKLNDVIIKLASWIYLRHPVRSC